MESSKLINYSFNKHVSKWPRYYTNKMNLCKVLSGLSSTSSSMNKAAVATSYKLHHNMTIISQEGVDNLDGF
jgi:hypothetical protein